MPKRRVVVRGFWARERRAARSVVVFVDGVVEGDVDGEDDKEEEFAEGFDEKMWWRALMPSWRFVMRSCLRRNSPELRVGSEVVSFVKCNACEMDPNAPEME